MNDSNLTTAAGVPLTLDDIILWARLPSRLPPFSEQALALCDQLSLRLMRHPLLGREPDVIALAFWLRRASLIPMIRSVHERSAPDIVRVPRGMAFHLPPTNVDTLFIYSWALSFLLGNRNLVRLSRRHDSLAGALCHELMDLFQTSDLPDIALNSCFISYDHDDGLTIALSALADLRVIWGGDESVNHIRQLPLPPLAQDVVFPSRTSLAVLDVNAVLQMTDESLFELAHHFFNDTYTFDQMACSSPRKLVWVGQKVLACQAEHRFLTQLAAVIAEKRYEPATSAVLQKVTLAAGGLIDGSASRQTSYGNAVTVTTMTDIQAELADFCGGGLLMSLCVPDVQALLPLMKRREQTMTVFGLPKSELQDLAVKAGAASVDRIVPIGQALSFSSQWDGMDLLDMFSRHVHITIPEACETHYD